MHVQSRMNKKSSFLAPDFRALFESAPASYLVLRTDFIIVAVSDAYLQATMTKREEILGRGLFEVFPDNPNDPAATGVFNLNASLQRVLKNRAADAMAVQKYDIRRPEAEGGGFEERHWSPVNSPVFGENNEIIYILHRVEDVTEFVRLKQLGAEQHKVKEELQSRVEKMEMELLLRMQGLQTANKRLRDSEIFLDSIIDNLPSMIFVKDAKELRFILLNKAGQKLLGYSQADLAGKNDYDFFPREQADFFVNKDRQMLQDGVLLDIPEEPIQTRNHGTRFLHTKKIPIFDSSGNPNYLLGISEDITERKAAEEEIRELNFRLQQKIRELESVNQELESFSYSVSHDLRAPLRAIDGFSREVLETYNDSLDAQGQDQLRRVRAASQRMGHLIDDLLKLARITRTEMQRSEVDLSAIAREIFSEQQRQEPRDRIEVSIAPNLRVHADPNLMRVALDNLLGNARKFSGRRNDPRIEFGSQRQDDETVFFVRDNGAGFDMAYADKLFGAFQRLHPASEFEGTGIGLATVQRIIRRHGGHIWAQAQINSGATFFFTLPRKND